MTYLFTGGRQTHVPEDIYLRSIERTDIGESEYDVKNFLLRILVYHSPDPTIFAADE